MAQIEELYKKCHAAIRADPEPKSRGPREVKVKRWNRAKMSKAQRDDRVKQKKAHFMKNLEADDD